MLPQRIFYYFTLYAALRRFGNPFWFFCMCVCVSVSVLGLESRFPFDCFCIQLSSPAFGWVQRDGWQRRSEEKGVMTSQSVKPYM